MFARPVKWDSDAAPPKILVIPPKKGGPRKGRERPFTVGVGDRVLARLAPAGDDTYESGDFGQADTIAELPGQGGDRLLFSTASPVLFTIGTTIVATVGAAAGCCKI